MPEGDSVWRLARRLQPLEGRTIVAAELRVPQLSTKDLAGRRARVHAALLEHQPKPVPEPRTVTVGVASYQPV